MTPVYKPYYSSSEKSAKEIPGSTTSLASEIAASAARIERWLLSEAVQVSTGPAAGGIAGWLDVCGAPAFAYGEITGYWLTWACSASRCGPGAERIGAAVHFLADSLGQKHPQTRHYLRPTPLDWRNRAVFSFDLAMVLRGLSCAAKIIGVRPCAGAVEAVTAWLLRCLAREGSLATHIVLNGEPLPQRWSTRPGPFQMKTAACLLAAPVDWLPPELISAAQRTLEKWQGQAGAHLDLHPRFYALEGEILTGAPPDPELAGTIVGSGVLTPTANGPVGEVRSDVLAQAIRILVLAERDSDLATGGRAIPLLRTLLDHITEAGEVLFDAQKGPRNIWCAIFAQQALSWLAGQQRNEPIDPRTLV